jgi:integrase/recombinase XerD
MDYISAYKDELIRQSSNKNTISSYISDITKYIEWFNDTYGKYFDGKILVQDARGYKSYLLNIKHLKPSSINRKMNALKSFNKYLCAIGTGREAEIELVNIVDRGDRNIKIIDKNSFNKLKRCFYDENNGRDIAVFEILSNTGIRVSELISLETKDIVLTDKNGEKNYSYVKIREGKGERYREVPLNSVTKKAINDYLKVRPKINHNKLFIGQRGSLTRVTINKILTKYSIYAQIEPISPHVLRHTFSTRLIKEGIDPVTVSRLLGHSSVKITTDFYVNTSRTDKMNAVELLGN